MTAAQPVLSPRRRRADGCAAVAVTPGVDRPEAETLSRVAKALGDPTRLQLLDALRRASPEAVCQCELVPLFAMTQPALAKHLRILVDAGVVGSERRGSWTYYYPQPGGLEALTAWLGDGG